MPIAATSPAVTPACAMAARTVATTLCQISSGSCSTSPSPGKCWVNSCWALASGVSAVSNTIARDEVVPWSTAMRQVGMSYPRLAPAAIMPQLDLSCRASSRMSRRSGCRFADKDMRQGITLEHVQFRRDGTCSNGSVHHDQGRRHVLGLGLEHRFAARLGAVIVPDLHHAARLGDARENASLQRAARYRLHQEFVQAEPSRLDDARTLAVTGQHDDRYIRMGEGLGRTHR